MVGAAGGNPCTRPPALPGNMDIITRQQALAQGLTHYFTGKACRNGHVSIRGTRKWNCLECDRNCKSKERQRDPDRVRANERRTAAKHRQSRLQATQGWRERNQDRLKAYSQAFRIRYQTDAKFRAQKQAVYNLHAQKQRDLKTNRAISLNLKNRINNAVSVNGVRKAQSTFDLTGCTVPELRQHLQAQFTDGMNWSNYGRTGWHIDHIRPCASFDLADPKQQRQCFHYTNLQPLWAADNIRKGGKWQKPAE
jgi:hypothetical protein